MSNDAEVFLKKFLHEYIKWIDAGAPKGDNNFSRERGLCPMLFDYAWSQGLWGSQRDEVLNLLTTLFQQDKLNDKYPFNNGSEDAYVSEINRARAHLNKRRIQWARDHV